MILRVFIHETAEAEINEAADFYDIQAPGLGAVFLDEVQHIIEAVMLHPQASMLLRGNLRRKLMAKFPYSLVYSVRPNEIRVLAIAHQKRRPFYWRGRR
jgi:plasmid stabilization system protein ParE